MVTTTACDLVTEPYGRPIWQTDAGAVSCTFGPGRPDHWIRGAIPLQQEAVVRLVVCQFTLDEGVLSASDGDFVPKDPRSVGRLFSKTYRVVASRRYDREQKCEPAEERSSTPAQRWRVRIVHRGGFANGAGSVEVQVGRS